MWQLSRSLQLKRTFWSAVREDWLREGCSLGWVSHCECLRLSWQLQNIFKCYVQDASSNEVVTAVFNPCVVVVYVEKFLCICNLIGSFENKQHSLCDSEGFVGRALSGQMPFACGICSSAIINIYRRRHLQLSEFIGGKVFVSNLWATSEEFTCTAHNLIV